MRRSQKMFSIIIQKLRNENRAGYKETIRISSFQTFTDIDPTQKNHSRHCRMANTWPTNWVHVCWNVGTVWLYALKYAWLPYPGLLSWRYDTIDIETYVCSQPIFSQHFYFKLFIYLFFQDITDTMQYNTIRYNAI